MTLTESQAFSRRIDLLVRELNSLKIVLGQLKLYPSVYRYTDQLDNMIHDTRQMNVLAFMSEEEQ